MVINCFDACFCKTELAGGLTGVLEVIFKIFEWMFARPAEEVSRLVVVAAAVRPIFLLDLTGLLGNALWTTVTGVITKTCWIPCISPAMYFALQ
jgi:hypothetical protein